MVPAELATDIYKPDERREFFLMVGGGAAALTGLAFVAMSLNLQVIAKDATQRPSTSIGIGPR